VCCYSFPGGHNCAAGCDAYAGGVDEDAGTARGRDAATNDAPVIIGAVAAGSVVKGVTGTDTTDGERAAVAKRLVMPSTNSDQDDSPWSFSRRKYH
jgi:hypothetical protein